MSLLTGGVNSPPAVNLLEYLLGVCQLEPGSKDNCLCSNVNDDVGLREIGYHDIHTEAAKGIAPLSHPLPDVYSLRGIVRGCVAENRFSYCSVN